MKQLIQTHFIRFSIWFFYSFVLSFFVWHPSEIRNFLGIDLIACLNWEVLLVIALFYIPQLIFFVPISISWYFLFNTSFTASKYLRLIIHFLMVFATLYFYNVSMVKLGIKSIDSPPAFFNQVYYEYPFVEVFVLWVLSRVRKKVNSSDSNSAIHSGP